MQTAVYQKLLADATLAALLAIDPNGGSPTLPAVFDRPPQVPLSETDSDFPFITIGDMTAAEFDTDDKDGQETTVIIHVWSRYRGTREIKSITDRIHEVLHNAALDVQGHDLIYCFWESADSIPDPDPLVQHGVTRFRIATQET